MNEIIKHEEIENTGVPVDISWFEMASAPVGTIWTNKQECDECTYEGSLIKVAESETDMHFEFTRTKINNKTKTSVTETKQMVYPLLSEEAEEAYLEFPPETAKEMLEKELQNRRTRKEEIFRNRNIKKEKNNEETN